MTDFDNGLWLGKKQSIPQTRLRLRKMMIGLELDSGGKEWEDETDDGGRGMDRTWEMDEKQRRMRKGDGTVKKKTAAKG